MDIRILIDAIVRQTTVLVAQIATQGGDRAPLAHLANQVFVDLARELHESGVGRKVSADMFGMALRTYQRRVRRLEESCTFRGRSLWQAILGSLGPDQTMSQDEIVNRFRADDPDSVKAILNDLTESGLAFRSGTGGKAVYKGATEAPPKRDDSDRSAAELVLAIIYREGPLGRKELDERVGNQGIMLDAVLDGLVAAGRIDRKGSSDADAQYGAREILIPPGSPVGWEAAVLDHYASVVRTICAKLAGLSTGDADSAIGGSTYSFEVWDGHPHYAEVMATLKEFRERNTAVREKVQDWNRQHPAARASVSRVTCYAGQYHVEAAWPFANTDDDSEEELSTDHGVKT